jgi:hypothetical protein
MVSMKAAKPLKDQKISLQLNIFRREFLDIHFPLDMSSFKPSTSRPSEVKKEVSYRFVINLVDIQSLKKVKHDGGIFSLIISLDSPPRFFRRFNNVASSHAPNSRRWNGWDAWYRQTDVVSDPSSLKKEALTLRKPNAIIDLGQFLCGGKRSNFQ